jgi:hypothetical protein
MMWLLIVCIGGIGGCDKYGGVATALVSEAQCRAAVENRVTGSLAWCVGPRGEMIIPKKG